MRVVYVSVCIPIISRKKFFYFIFFKFYFKINNYFMQIKFYIATHTHTRTLFLLYLLKDKNKNKLKYK